VVRKDLPEWDAFRLVGLLTWALPQARATAKSQLIQVWNFNDAPLLQGGRVGADKLLSAIIAAGVNQHGRYSGCEVVIGESGDQIVVAKRFSC